MRTSLRSFTTAMLLAASSLSCGGHLATPTSGTAPRPAPSTGPARPPATDTGALAPAATRRTHENLNAVLWMQTSVEYRASALQAYALARRQLDAALADPQWTAALEQTGSLATRRPAVVLDLDETVLDNSGFQARMTADTTFFTDAAWHAWCEERKATAIPGAVEFLAYAAGRGVTPIFITNRDSSVEQATRDVLARLGVPLDATRDTVFTRNERPEWAASDKTSRRAAVASEFRILLLVGDDLGDFLGNARGTTAERDARSAPHDAYWGTRWIMLPNPSYGSWETAFTAGQAGMTDAQTLAVKYGRLRVAR